jgi:DNA-binding NtrC family response regulator
MSFSLPTQGAAATHSAPRKVLLVDHDCSDLDRQADALRQQRGYDVQVCSHYDEGVQRLEREPFDFVLVCQGSPGFEGRSVLERAIAIDRRMPVLVVTRHPNMRCYLEAMQLGAFDYVEKPVEPSALAKIVEMHMRPLAGTRARLRPDGALAEP